MFLHIPIRNNGLLLVKNNHYFYKGDSGFYDLNCTWSKNVKRMHKKRGFYLESAKTCTQVASRGARVQ